MSRYSPSPTPEIHFGPFGTNLPPNLRKPESIETAAGLTALGEIAAEYRDHGANIGVTATYGLNRYHAGLEFEEFRKLLGKHVDCILAGAKPSTINGVMVSHGSGTDAYTGEGLSKNEASEFHHPALQAGENTLRNLSAPTRANLFEALGHAEEALGILQSQGTLFRPGTAPVLSFVVDQNGILPSGQTFWEAVKQICAQHPDAQLGINCAPIKGIEIALRAVEKNCPQFIRNVRHIYPNAAENPFELDGATQAVQGDMLDTVNRIATLTQRFRDIQSVSGCCGFTPADIACIKRTL